MPLDLNQQSSDAENQLAQLIKGQSGLLDQNLAKYQATAQSGRNAMLDPSQNTQLGGILSNLRLSPTSEAKSYEMQKLQSNLQQNLNQAKFQGTNANLKLGLQNAGRVQGQAYNKLANANQYGYSTQNQNTQQAFQAQQADLQRQQQVTMNDLSQGFSQQGFDLQALYDPQVNYSQALTRALAGVTGAGLGMYAYKQQNAQPAGGTYNPAFDMFQTPAPVNSGVMYGPQNMAGLIPSGLATDTSQLSSSGLSYGSSGDY